MNIILTTIACFLIVLKLCSCLLKKNTTLKNCRSVPKVQGRLPFVGNGIQFIRNSTEFIREAFKTYGQIFSINLFGSEFVLICDREMKKSFFKSREDHLSLYSLFDSIYMVDALVNSKHELIQMANIFKKAISLRPQFIEVMNSEAKMLIEKLSNEKNKGIQLGFFLREYVTRTSFRCFVSTNIDEVSPKFFSLHYRFSKLVNLSILLAFIVPKYILDLVWRPVLRYYRRKMFPLLLGTIQNARKCGSQNYGPIIKKALDFVDESNGQSLSDEQIADIIMSLMWISTENTALGLLDSCIDLIVNSKYWTAVKDEIKDYVDYDDCKAIINSPLLNACLMESARLNTHPLSICRVPGSRDLVIGEDKYWIGNASVVAVSAPLWQVFECSKGIFENSNVYNPSRYTDNKENFASKNVMTWGSGVHLCPGKDFAVYEIKIGLAFLVRYLQILSYSGHEHVTQFATPAFLERDICVNFSTDYKA